MKAKKMRTLALALVLAASALSGCASDGYGQSDNDFARYDYDHPDPRYNGYEADRYYRDGPQYQERSLSENDRLYRGNDGKYYCRRSDGTTGLVVGALAGGVLGDLIAPRGSKTLGTLLGAGGGAIAGSAIDRSQMRCR